VALDDSDRDLAVLALRGQNDGVLSALAAMVLDAERGLGLGITVLIGGVMIAGEVTSPARFAADFDAKLLEGLKGGAAEHERDEVVADVIAKIEVEGWFRKMMDRGRAERERVQAELDALDEDEEVNEDLARQDIDVNQPPITLNLSQATVFPPNATPFKVDVVRVKLSNVDAWWTGVTSV
jgi:hypothetical protein